MSVQETSREGLSRENLKPLQTIGLKEIVTDAVWNSTQFERIVRDPSGTRRDVHHSPRVNVEVFSPSHCSHSSISKWSRNIEPFNTSIDGFMAQERNLTSFYTEKSVWKFSPAKSSLILAQENGWTLRVLSSAKVQSSWILGSCPSTQWVNQTQSSPPLPERKDWTVRGGGLNGNCLASSHGIERVSETKVYSNHIKKYELETITVFER